MNRSLGLLVFVVTGLVSGAQSNPTIVTTTSLCSISFDRDKRCPVRVDNEAKACLDDIALNLQRSTDVLLVIVGSRNSHEPSIRAGQRALSSESYLVREKGIDTTRITLLGNTAPGAKRVTNTLVPSGAVFDKEETLKTVSKSLRLPPCNCHPHCETDPMPHPKTAKSQ
jgi:hypothetical protein